MSLGVATGGWGYHSASGALSASDLCTTGPTTHPVGQGGHRPNWTHGLLHGKIGFRLTVDSPSLPWWNASFNLSLPDGGLVFPGPQMSDCFKGSHLKP